MDAVTMAKWSFWSAVYKWIKLLNDQGRAPKREWKAGSIICIFTLRRKRSKKGSGKRVLLESNYVAENIIAFQCFQIFYLRTAQCSSQGELWQLFLLSCFVNKHGTNFFQATVIIYLFICLFHSPTHLPRKAEPKETSQLFGRLTACLEEQDDPGQTLTIMTKW